MADTNAVIAVYDTHPAADEAVKELQKAGFDMKKLSVVGKDYHTEDQVVGYFFWVPGIGPVLVGGPLVAWIIAALEGAAVVGGLSAVGAGLYSLGIPKDSIVEYETAVKVGNYVVVAHGTADEAAKAKSILSTWKPSSVTDHVLEPTGAAVAS
jgi:hypothetical protein